LASNPTDCGANEFANAIAANGNLTCANPATAIQNAAADGATKGVASFAASDFNASSGNISLDYVNGQAGSASSPGFISSADWSTFNGKLSDPLTTKGDVLGYSTATTRIPVGSNGQVLTADSTEALGLKWATPSGAGLGDVSGPASSTDNAIARFDSTTGKIIQNSGITVDDSDRFTSRLSQLISNTSLGSNYAGIDQSVSASKTGGITGANVYGINSSVDTSGTASLTGDLLGANIILADTGTGARSDLFGLRVDASSSGSTTGNISGNLQGANITASYGKTGTAANVSGVTTSIVNSDTGTMTSAIGLNSTVQNVVGGTITSAIGLQVSLDNDDVGTVTTGYGVKVNAPTNVSGTVGTYYGLHVAGVENYADDHAIYVAQGKTTLLDTASIDGQRDAVQLNIQGNATQTSNILNVEKDDGTDLLSVTNTAGTLIRGTTTNDAAAAGFVGEYVEVKNNSATSCPTSGTIGGDHTISLTAGDWDASFTLYYDENAATTATQSDAWIGTVTGNSATGRDLGNNYGTLLLSAIDEHVLAVPSYRISIASTTSYYLKVRCYYTGTAPDYRYRLSARRVR
jgi:hypothetical protein